ncbi:mitochondrial precursor [Zalerion maritima]|uniref:Mitochondrial n=1 Tax=Zalerion maritima TaxID=339359 RepID=A0AAD5WQX4_9PEZI|nr:mitochondrial precursor [Zalerion maritima]
MDSPAEPYASLRYFVLSHPSPHVAHVEINRADKLNAFHEAMWLEMGSVFRALSHDPEVRAVVLSGRGGKGFCAGLDVKAAAEGDMLGSSGGGKGKMDAARTSQKLRRHIGEFQGSVGEIERCDKPVIALLHGISFGLAIDIACCADIRLAVADAKFSVKEVDIGLAADIGSLARLPKVVGSSSWVREVCLTARIFGAEEAQRVGFVSRVCETKEKGLEAATALAGLISEKSPVAVMGTKEILKHSRDHSVDDNLRYTSVWNSAMLQSSDVQVALLSGIQKKKPRFEKL